MSRYKLGQIALNSKEKRMPELADQETYIGLEHLDSDRVDITRYGSKVPLKGSKLVAKKGDVLFGRRNAYLKRSAIAPFDCLFSAHGLVLRPNTEVVDPDFFPFFMSSEPVFNEAIRISVGSLSPTVNWPAFAECEFDLPEKAKQKELAAIMQQASALKALYCDLIKGCDDLAKSQFIELFGNFESDNWVPLPEIASYNIGLTYKPAEVSDSGTVVLRSGNIQNGAIDFGDIVKVDKKIGEKCLVSENDILMCSRNGSARLVGKTAIIPSVANKMAFGAFMTVFRTEHTQFLNTFFNTQLFREQINVGTATINQITVKMLDKVMIPVPAAAEENMFSEFAAQVDKSKFALQKALDDLNAMTKKIISQELGLGNV